MTVLLVLATGVVLYAFLTIPQWFATSMNRGALWQLRDQVYDDRMAGELAYDDAVARRIDMIEAAIAALPTLTPAKVSSTLRSAPLFADLPDDLDAVEVTDLRLVLVDAEFVRILSRHLVTGSWAGVAIGSCTARGRQLFRMVATRKRFGQKRESRSSDWMVPPVQAWIDGLRPQQSYRRLAV